jgi:hypothetical protein
MSGNVTFPFFVVDGIRGAVVDVSGVVIVSLPLEVATSVSFSWPPDRRTPSTSRLHLFHSRALLRLKDLLPPLDLLASGLSLSGSPLLATAFPPLLAAFHVGFHVG